MTTLSTVISDSVESHLSSLRVALPGKIESFNSSNQTCSVKPDGDFPVISGVPVVFAGANGYSVTFPVVKGDTCLLVFADQSIDDWWVGGDLVKDSRAHNLTDAICLLGLRPKGKVLSEFDTNRAVFGNKGPRVACDGNTVHLGVSHGEDATQSLLRGEAHLSALQSYIDNLLTAFDTLLLTGATGAGPVTFAGTAAFTAAKAAAKATYQAAAHTTNTTKVP